MDMLDAKVVSPTDFNNSNVLNKKNIIKQNVISCLVIFCFAIILMLPFFTTSNLYGADLKYHYTIINSLNEAWNNGSFFDRFLGLISQDYGYPTGIFYSTIPASIAVILINLLNLPINIALGFEFVILFTLSGLVVYGFAKSFSKNNVVSTVLSLIYVASPYILHDLYSRFAFSEIFLMLTTPMIFWGCYELLNNSSYKKFLSLFTIGFCISFLCHFVLTLYIALFVLIYLFFYVKDIIKTYKFVPLIISVFIVLLVAATYYVPVLANYGISSTSEMAFSPTEVYKQTIEMFKGIFVIQTMIFLCMFVILTVLIIKNRKNLNKHIVCLYIMFTICFVMSTCLFPWVIVPKILCMIQFPIRLNMILCTLSIPIMYYILISLNKTKNQTKNSIKWTFIIIISLVTIISYGLNLNSAYNFKDRLYSIQSSTGIDSPNNSFNEGMGYQKNGDYLPKNANEEYIFTRNQANILLSSSIEISELSNYQTKNQIRFIVPSSSIENKIILKIPYNVCDDISIDRYCTTHGINPEYKAISWGQDTVNSINYLSITIPESNYEAQIIISYSDNGLLDNYLKENPFEFIVKSGQANFSNFVKSKVNEYTVDIDTALETVIELPTLFYYGYEINYTTDDGTYELTAVNGENGFIEVTVKESGRLSIRFDAQYINISNIISIIGVCLFAITLVIALSVPRTFFKNIACKINRYLESHKTIAEIIRFLIVGGIATIADMLFMGITMYAMQPEIYSNFINVFINAPSPSTTATIVGTTVGFIVGLLINYVLSILFVFNEKGNSKSTKGFFIFVLLSAIGLFINVIGTYIAYDLLHIHQWIVKIIMIFIVLVYNYISKKLILFKNKPDSKKDNTDNNTKN